MEPLLVLVGLVAGAAVGAVGAYAILRSMASARVRLTRESAGRALSDAETAAKEIVLTAKEEAHRIRTTADDEIRERQSEVLSLEQRIQQRDDSIVQRLDELERRQDSLRQTESEHEQRGAQLAEREARVQQELARIAGMSQEQARNHLMTTLEKNLNQEIGNRIREAELTARQESEARAREVVVTAIQRIAADQTTESTVSAVHLPNDEMKGRIIGREGRNIRALELATGVDLIIDDTPETVMISGFDPVRREIARNALSRLLTDGRIHPSRIEEVVAKARSEVQAQIKTEGEAAVYEAGVHGAHPELIRLLGCLRFRTSYGQNVLSHSREVAMLCGAMAAEMGCGP
jgi:ribonuclease Y